MKTNPTSDNQNLIKRQEKINALDELFALSSKYRKSAEFLSLLKFINKFPNLSPFNAFLVHMQDGAASVVLTPSKWKSYGRKVKPLARPFIILIPFGPVEFVYNISDTEDIKPGVNSIPIQLTRPFVTIGDFNEEFFHRTCLNAAEEGIKYGEEAMQMGGAGYATSRSDQHFHVRVNRSYEINEKYSTLVHELGHIYCGHLGKMASSWWEERYGLSKEIREIEAESISFLVCSRHGLKTSSMEYLSNYIKDDKDLPGISMETILTVSNHIEKMGLKDFKPRKK